MFSDSPVVSLPLTPAVTAPWDEYSIYVDPHCRPDIAWDGVQPGNWAMNQSIAMQQMNQLNMPESHPGSPIPAPFHPFHPLARQDSQVSHKSNTSQPSMQYPTQPVLHLLDELSKLNQALIQETTRARSILSPTAPIPQGQIDANAAAEIKALISRTFRYSENFTITLKSVAETWSMANPAIMSSAEGSMHAGQDMQAYHVVGMHLASLYTTLTHLFGSILVYVRDCLLEPGSVGVDPQLSLPDLRIEGLVSLNSGYMQVRLLVEACVHLVELAHSRLRQIHNTGALGAIGSSALSLIVGGQGGSPISLPIQDLQDLPLSQQSIKELHLTILARMQGCFQ